MGNTSTTRSATCRTRWANLTDDEMAQRRAAAAAAQRKRWAEMPNDDKAAWHAKTAAARGASEVWSTAVARGRYRAAGVPEDEIDVLMTMTPAERKWARKRFVLYGVRPSDVAAMIEAQGGRCALCEAPLPKVYHVDHDHSAGHVRGLLCVGCNLLLGRIEQVGKAWVDRALAYVTTSTPEVG